MKIYFAGAVVPYADVVIKHHGQALLSFAEPQSIIKYLDKYPNEKIFLDSGAFTAFTQGKHIDIDDYIKFIQKNRKNLEVYATLDVIGDYEATIKNTEYLESKGLNPLPVFHYNSPEKELRRLIERYDYIALGGLVPLTLEKPRLKNWLDYCFSIIKDQTKVHGLGVTSKWCLQRYPFYTVDSTSYLQSSRFGSSKVIKNKEMITYNNKTKHYLERTEIEVIGTKLLEKNITKLWEQRGITWK